MNNYRGGMTDRALIEPPGLTFFSSSVLYRHSRTLNATRSGVIFITGTLRIAKL